MEIKGNLIITCVLIMRIFEFSNGLDCAQCGYINLGDISSFDAGAQAALNSAAAVYNDQTCGDSNKTTTSCTEATDRVCVKYTGTLTLTNVTLNTDSSASASATVVLRSCYSSGNAGCTTKTNQDLDNLSVVAAVQQAMQALASTRRFTGQECFTSSKSNIVNSSFSLIMAAVLTAKAVSFVVDRQ